MEPYQSPMSSAHEVPSPAMLAQDYEEHLRLLEEHAPEEAAGLQTSVKIVDIESLQRACGIKLGTKGKESFWIATGERYFIFLLVLADGKEVIARVRRPAVAGAEWSPTADQIQEATLSEIATLEYLRKYTSVPVPLVLAYEADPDCGVGSVYILEERVIGRRPQSIDFAVQAARLKWVEQVAGYEAQLYQQQFPHIGSLCRNTSSGSIEIGPFAPTVAHSFHLPANMRGPFTSLSEWVKVQAQCQMAFLGSEEFEVKNAADASMMESRALIQRWYKSIYDELDRLDYLRKMNDGPFILMHEDLCCTNFLVALDDPSRVVAIIDWEGARAVPIWLVAAFKPEVLELNSVPGLTTEQTEEVSRMRREILLDKVPDLAEAWDKGSGLCALMQLLSSRSVLAGFDLFQTWARLVFEWWPTPEPVLERITREIT